MKVIEVSNTKDKVKTIRKERNRGRLVESKGNTIYSYPVEKELNLSSLSTKDFKCGECKTAFNITATSEDILASVCPLCGSRNVDYLSLGEQREFNKKIRRS